MDICSFSNLRDGGLEFLYVRSWLVQRRHTGAFCTENLCNLLGFEVKVRTAGESDIFYIYILSIFTVLLIQMVNKDISQLMVKNVI